MPKFLQLTQNERQDLNPGLPDGKSTTAVKCNCYLPGHAPLSFHSRTPVPPARPPRPPGCSWRASNFKLPTNAFLSRIFFFFFFFSWREAEKAVPLGCCYLGLLKTLQGLKTTQKVGGCSLRSEPLAGDPPPNEEVWELLQIPL